MLATKTSQLPDGTSLPFSDNALSSQGTAHEQTGRDRKAVKGDNIEDQLAGTGGVLAEGSQEKMKGK